MVVATVGIGYADGVRRSLSNKGSVVIRGVKCPIIGSVCMDSFMVDVSNVTNVDVGDDVYIYGVCVFVRSRMSFKLAASIDELICVEMLWNKNSIPLGLFITCLFSFITFANVF